MDTATTMIAQQDHTRWCGINFKDYLDKKLYTALVLARELWGNFEPHLQKSGAFNARRESHRLMSTLPFVLSLCQLLTVP